MGVQGPACLRALNESHAMGCNSRVKRSQHTMQIPTVAATKPASSLLNWPVRPTSHACSIAFNRTAFSRNLLALPALFHTQLAIFASCNVQHECITHFCVYLLLVCMTDTSSSTSTHPNRCTLDCTAHPLHTYRTSPSAPAAATAVTHANVDLERSGRPMLTARSKQHAISHN